MLDAAARARQRAASDSRWFPWACVVLALLVIPGGAVVPWGLPARLYIMLAVFALLIGLVWLMSRKGVTPRGSKSALNIAVGCWIGLSVIMATIGRNIDHIGLGLVCSAVASAPFIVLAVCFRARRNALR